MSNTFLYVVGGNAYGQLSLDETGDIRILTKWNESNPDINVIKLSVGSDHTIFMDSDNNYWAAGQNNYGQCSVSSDGNDICKCTKITYFDNNDVKVRKACTNVGSDTTFWITNDNKLYGNGYNGQCQLGYGKTDITLLPVLIENINDVIDVQCSYTFSIAICNSSKYHPVIIEFWIKQIRINIPEEIINLLKLFANSYDCLGTGHIECMSNDEDGESISGITHKWAKIDVFNDTQIINIAAGYNHALFVEANGNLWSVGGNSYGQLGVGKSLENTYRASIPIKIEYFEINKIKVCLVSCGWYHCLVTDINGKAYGFGRNDDGQLGLGAEGSNVHVHEPTRIEALSDYNVIDIGCGAWHSYIKNEKEEHFLFGDNGKNQCSLISTPSVALHMSSISTPFCINGVFAEICSFCINGGNKKIKSVHLTRHSTIIIATT